MNEPFLSSAHTRIGLRIGTRGSALALVQTNLFIDRLKRIFPQFREKDSFEIVRIRASGDHHPGQKDELLYHQGGKGLFTQELEAALHEDRIDIAVHSMKDVPTFLPDDFSIAAVLPREDPRDVFLSLRADRPEKLPEGALIGTSSPRRHAQVLHRWPHLKPVPFRGNVDTRLRKIEAGQVQGAFLAYAGLKRLDLDKNIQRIMDVEEMLPCAGQGIIGLEIRKSDQGIAEMLARINCSEAFTALQAERAMLAVLGGSCQTPIGGLARLEGKKLVLKGMVAHPEGKGLWEAEEKGLADEAEALGKSVGQKLHAQTPPGILPE